MATVSEQIQQIYIGLLGRAADQAGLDYWTNEIETGVLTIEQLRANIVNEQPEYIAGQGSMTRAQAVADLYENLFNRLPDAQGLEYWVNGEGSSVNVDQLVLALIDGASAADQLVLDNKTEVAEYYTAAAGDDYTKEAATGAVDDVNATRDSVEDAIDAIDAGTIATGETFKLTTGIDQGAAFVGTSGNDTFNALDGAAAAATFTALDSIDGGAGTDTLNIIQTTAVAAVPSAVVKNIETANVTSGADVNIDTTAWTGLTQLNVTSAATAAETITAATTTGVSITNSTAFDVNVVGGGLVGSVTTGATGTITIGKAGGGAGVAADANAFTSVSIKGGNAAFVTDNSGTTGAIGTKLTAVTVDGTAGTVALAGDAIADVTVKNGVAATAVTVTNAATADQTLNLTLDNNAAGVNVVDATAKTVTVTATGTKASTIDLTIAGATALTTAGAADLTLATVAEDYAALKTLTINNTGAFNADLSAANSASAAALTSIVATASTGANTLAIDATKTTYAGGSGVDTVAVVAAATKTVDGGAGTADVINLAGVGGTLLTAATAAKITNFEVLSTTGGSGNFDVALLTGITGLTQGVLGGAVVYNNVAAGTGLKVTASAGNTTAYNLANVLGTTDVFNLTVSSAAAVDTGAITANGVETINVASTDTDTTQHQNTVSLASNALKSVVFTGNAGVALTAADTTITSVDASALSLTGTVAANGGFTWTSGAVTDNLVVKGSATGGDNIDVSLAATATKTVTVTTYAGTNTIDGSDTLVNNITGGTGADTIIGGAAADVIVGGGGADVITGGAGADKITISGNTATVTIAAIGDSGANTSDSIQVAELTSTFDVVIGATAGTKIDLAAIDNTFATADLVLNGTNLAGQDDKIVFVNGTYNADAGTFTYAANGPDTVVTYDTTVAAGTAYESIILVGVDAGATTSAAAGIITLA
ncbi:DUF4214 domain-containing protein [Thauera aromatica]|uniref:Flagellar hook-length control protein FliK n=1 Tax=Thauera aromatica K172 TaxID=44139 RepID=A0A2R4BKN6_THAAR|nr:DUF4214 domain-containing protein [Thauera aromatica]AVR87888.1 Flagellar hook-length control protein FliK [Thauera aromatica K172]